MLAEHLGMTVSQLLDNVSSMELSEWNVYFRRKAKEEEKKSREFERKSRGSKGRMMGVNR